MPKACVLPSTGIVATMRSGVISRNLIPIFTTRAPTPPASQGQRCSGTPASASSCCPGPAPAGMASGMNLSLMGTRLASVSETNKPDSVATIERPAEAETANGGDGRLLVIDGHSMAFRAFYALPADKFATDTGQHTNAVYGFTSMLLAMIREQQPTHVVVAFDLDTPTFRSEEYSEYKAGRNKTPEEFHGQVDLIVKVMEAMRIPTITMDGYEA